MKTHLQKVQHQLDKKGFVTRNWCLQHGITRLAARIADLRSAKYNIEAGFGKKLGMSKVYWKDYVYLKK